MKASLAQSKSIKQQEQILTLLTMIAGAVGLEVPAIQTALDVQERIVPTKKPRRTKQQVAEDLSKIVKEVHKEREEKPDSRDMSQPVQQEESDNSPEPNKLPEITNE